jgi:hypothetical protein
MQTAQSALPTATRCLRNQPESSVRAICAGAVAAIAADEREAAEILIQSLKSEESPTVRASAVRAAGRLTGAAGSLLPIITDALGDSEVEVRTAAVESLARLRARSAIPALRKVYEKDPELELRIDAAAQLCQLEGNQQALRSLVYWVEDAEQELEGNQQALRSLVYWVEEAEQEGHRFRALLRLVGLDQPPHDTLIDALQQSEQRFMKLRILRALGRSEQQLNPKSGRLIFPYALSWDVELRQAAIDALLPGLAADQGIHEVISGYLKRSFDDPLSDGQSAAPQIIDFLYRTGSAGLRRHEGELRQLLEKIGGTDGESIEGALETVDEEDLCFGESAAGTPRS